MAARNGPLLVSAAATGATASDSTRVDIKTARAYVRSRSLPKNPAGEIAHAEATRPVAASSSAMPPPIELPATCHGSRPRSAASPADGVGQRLHRLRARRRVAEAGQVDGDHVMVAREQRDHRPPHLLARAEAVKKQQRRAGADTVVGEHRLRA